MSGLWMIIILGLAGTALTVGAAFMTAHAQLRQASLLRPLALLGIGVLIAVGSWAGAGVMLHNTIAAARAASQLAPQPVQQRKPGKTTASDDQLAVGRDVQYGQSLKFAHNLTVKVGAPTSRNSEGAKVEQVTVTLRNRGTQQLRINLADFQMYNSGAAMPQLTTLSSQQVVPAGQTRTVQLLFQVADQHDEGQLVVSYHGAGWEWQGTAF